MAVALVQGASRGIGLQFCRHILKAKPEVQIIATCRSPGAAPELQQLKVCDQDNVEILQLDGTQQKHIIDTSEHVKDKYGYLDLLINSAGMLHPSGRGETSLKNVTSEVLS